MIKERLKKLRKLMKENNIDIYYVPSDDSHMSEYVADYFHSREYVTGFTGSAGVCVITEKEAGLWTDGRYFTQAENQLKNTSVKLYKQRQLGVINFDEFIASKIKNGGTLGFDGRVVNQNMKEKFEEIIKEKNGNIKLDKDLVGEIWGDRPSMPKDKVFFLKNKYTGESSDKKIARIRKEMLKNGSDVLVFSTLEDICWLFNIRGNDVLNTPVVYSYALVLKDVTNLYVDTTKLDKEVLKELKKSNVVIKEYEEISKDLLALQNKKIWVDKTKLNSYLFNNINSSNNIINLNNPAALFRAMKNKTELNNLRKSHIKDGVAITKLIYYVKNNVGKEEMSELSITEKLLNLRKQQDGFITPSFDTICAYKGNGAMMHYKADENSNAKILNEGFLLIDSGGTYYDGTTDITRTLALGKISEEEKRYYTLVLKGMLRLMSVKFLHGTTGSNLDILARSPLWNEYIDYRSGTGHGVGYVLSVHEGPQSVRWGYTPNAAVIEEGMILTDEPGVYIPNKLGIRIENELIALNSVKNEYGQFMEFETITYCPIDLDAVDVNLMTFEEINTLNDYHAMVYDKLSPHLSEKEKVWLKLQTRKIKK